MAEEYAPPGDISPEVASKMLEIASKEAMVSKQSVKNKASQEKKGYKPLPKANAKKWLDRIERSKKLGKPFREDSERFMRMYQGDYSEKPGKKARYEHMCINLIYSNIETITPAVFSGFPYIRARPRPKIGQDPTAAQIMAENAQAVIHYWFRKLNTDGELHDVFFDTFFGHAAVELGWETAVEERSGSYEGPEDSGGDDNTVTDDATDSPPPDLIAAIDRPFIKRRDPWEVGFDVDQRRRKDGNWLFTREVMRYNDFIESAKFTDDAKKKIKPQIYPENSDVEQTWMGRDEQKGEKEWVELFTVWDKTCRKKYVVSKGYLKFVNTDDPEGEDWEYDIDYKNDPFPICVHDGKRDRKLPYSWSEFKAYEAQVLELNRLRSAMQIHVKRTLPKYVYSAQAGTRHKVAKLMNARSDEAVELDNPSAIAPFPPAEIPIDLKYFAEMSMQDLIKVSGISEYEAQGIQKTATEANIDEGRSQVRKSLRSKAWEQFVVEIATKLFQLCQQYMDTQEVIEVAGQAGTEWRAVGKHEIQGEFDFEIEPGIMEYKNESLETQQLLKFAEIAGNDPNVNKRKLISKIAQKFDLSPEDILLTEDQVAASMPPAEPNIEFKDIDPGSITDPVLQQAIIEAAMQQNGVNAPAPAPAMPGTPGEMGMNSPGGKDLAGGNPNGNPNLPPVSGNLVEGLGS